MKKEKLREKREFNDVRELLEWAAVEYSDRVAFSYALNPHAAQPEVVRLGYGRLRDDVRALTTALRLRGAEGRHVVLIGKLSYEWALTYYSVLCAGGVLVPLDREWSGEELSGTSKRADAAFVIVDADCIEKGRAVCEALDGEVPLFALGGEAEGAVALSSLMETGQEAYAADPGLYHAPVLDVHKMSLLVFTSGTTGKGKGVMLSQHNILKDIADVIPYVDFRRKTIGVLPPHHTYGSSTLLIGHVMIGAEVYISAGIRFIVKEMKQEKPGHMILVPLYLETFYRRILANIKEKGKEKLVRTMIKASGAMRRVGIDVRKKLFAEIRNAFGGNLDMIISGGAPINGEILSFFEAIGISTLNGYGITECAPIIAFNRSRHVVPGSVGTVLDIDHVRIDQPNEEGEGEILVTGPNVMLGYYKDEAATAEAIDSDGYFHTGDYGKLSRDNILTITGRKKNLIILSNGKNVYPEEIESELVAASGIQDVIVYEGQSRRGLEHNAIVAEIYPDEDYMKNNGITDVRAHLQKHIDDYNRNAISYKKIGVLKVRTEDFPKNTLRKIMRFKLDMSID